MIHSKKSAMVAGWFSQALKTEEGRAKKDWANFDPQGNVYLIGNKDLGYYKIGLTRSKENPDARFKTIQNSVPFELDVLRYWFVSHAGSFEKLLHYELRDHRIRGEWFRFQAEELTDIISKIKDLVTKSIAKVDSVLNQQDTE